MANPGKWFKLIIKDEQKRQKLFEAYVHWKAIYCLGESEIGFFKSLTGFQSIAVYYLVAEQVAAKMGWHINIAVIAVLIPCWLVFKICLYVGLGLFWDKNRFIHYTQEWSNKRNPTIQEIRSNIATAIPTKNSSENTIHTLQMDDTQCFKCREWINKGDPSFYDIKQDCYYHPKCWEIKNNVK